jgi:type IV pilus assembly protein PilB
VEWDLGKLLVEQGNITPEQLLRARAVRRPIRGSDLARVLIDLGFITETAALHAKAAVIAAVQALAASHGIPYIELDSFGVDPAAVSILPADVARSHRVFPVTASDLALTVATSDPENRYAEEEVRLASGLQVRWVVALRDAIERAIARYYGGLEWYEEWMTVAPVARIAHTIVQDAAKANASRILIEPGVDLVSVSYQIDGVLRETMTLHKHVHPALVAFHVLRAGMDPEEHTLGQDGHSAMFVNGKEHEIDLHVQPTSLGEKLVIDLRPSRDP